MTTTSKNTASIIFGWFLMILSTVFLTFKFFNAEKYEMSDLLIGLWFGIGMIFAKPKSPLAEIIMNIFKRKSEKI